MSSVLKIAIACSALCAGTIICYLVQSETATQAPIRETGDYIPQHGIVERPSDAKVLAGRYQRGNGAGSHIYLTLGADGRYTAEWADCFGTYREAAGVWKIGETHILFATSPGKETSRSHLSDLEVLKFNRHWILLSTNKSDRESYDKWGVSTYSCFQNTNIIFPGP